MGNTKYTTAQVERELKALVDAEAKRRGMKEIRVLLNHVLRIGLRRMGLLEQPEGKAA